MKNIREWIYPSNAELFQLAFVDLRRGDGPSRRVQDRLSRRLPPVIAQYATTWARTALDGDIAGKLSECAQRRTSAQRRFALINEIRVLNQRLGNPGGW